MSFFKLTNEQVAKNLENLDLEPIMVKLMDQEEGQGWSLELTKAMIDEYKKFLFLMYVHPNANLVPNHNLDTVWHQHALDTLYYRKDCEAVFSSPFQIIIASVLRFIFGKFGFTISSTYREHFPYFGMRGVEDELHLESAFEETIKLFETLNHTLVMHSDIADEAARCRSCHYCKEFQWIERPRLSSLNLA
jgi:hypothetical protein